MRKRPTCETFYRFPVAHGRLRSPVVANSLSGGGRVLPCDSNRVRKSSNAEDHTDKSKSQKKRGKAAEKMDKELQ